MAVPKRRRFDWANLFITSGLAASVAALGGFANEFMSGARTSETRQCEIAASVLQDETPSPYLDAQTQKHVMASAAARFDACMKE